MRALLVLLGLIALVLLAALGLGFINIDQTQTAQLPSLQGGQMPKFDATVSRVDVGVENKTVAVPTLEVQKPAGQ